MKTKKLGKRFLALFISLCLMSTALTGLTLPVAAATTSGTTGDCTWTLDGTTLTISGSGAMQNFTISSAAPWGTDITEAIIEDGVTIIGNRAFRNCTKLESVTLPDGIISIGEAAFYNCGTLTSIILPDSVTSIGWSAFERCVNLTSINIPYGVEVIEEGTFFECFSLESISIPVSVKTIGTMAFYDCISLETVYYCGTDAWWNGIAISKDESIEDNTYLINAKRVQQHEFKWVVDEPASCGVPGIKHEECVDCGTVQSVGTTIETLEHTYDGDCDTECNVCKEIRTAQPHTYSSDFDVKCNICNYIRDVDCSFLTYTVSGEEAIITGCDESVSGDIIIPSTIDGYIVTGIDICAFFACASISGIIVPDGVKTIGDFAFYECGGLVSITLPNSIVSIGVDAFSDCGSLASIYYSGVESDREKISVEEGNEALTDATWYYNRCNVTGEEHVYSYVCDTDCNLCGKERTTAEPHAYDSYYDLDCNTCGFQKSNIDYSFLSYTVSNGKATITGCN